MCIAGGERRSLDFDINKIESLGLHIVNLLVTQLDGKIKFISNNGTKIMLEFPLLENQLD